jgi:hypothetical protein
MSAPSYDEIQATTQRQIHEILRFSADQAARDVTLYLQTRYIPKTVQAIDLATIEAWKQRALAAEAHRDKLADRLARIVNAAHAEGHGALASVMNALDECFTPPQLICGVGDPNNPSEHTCELPRGHAPGELNGAPYEHAAPSMGVYWSFWETPAYTQIADDTATSLLGETVHTGLRKGSAQPEADPLWHSIANAPTAWSDALLFAVDGLHEMGYALCRQTAPGDTAPLRVTHLPLAPFDSPSKVQRKSSRDDRISPDAYYLALIYGTWHLGHFSSQHYGWSFDNWGTSGIQLDSIQDLYEIDLPGENAS